MNFYEQAFPEKLLKLFVKKACNYPSTLPFLDRAMPARIIFFKSILYMQQICGVAKKSKIF